MTDLERELLEALKQSAAALATIRNHSPHYIYIREFAIEHFDKAAAAIAKAEGR